MADEPTPAPKSDEDEPLREEGIRALRAEREANKQLKEQLRELSEWKEAQENAGKSEAERLTAENARLKAESTQAAKDAVRLRVALAKGLTAKQAARLVGEDEEALLADADDLLSSFKPAGEPEEPEGPELDGGPRPRLKGGARPTDEPLVLDPAKLAADIAAISQ
ncbi:hypothetical protein ACFWY9_28620 [Amycolatopsis sp. NPDC059027]|uniref:hypothetical protein n=1 Tax=Amycolatopsis sp. NPDC059027 TaxID=3346709 RepID=UPI00366C2374